MILQDDTKIHYTHMEPEGLRLLYSHITLIFNGAEPKVEVKGTFVDHQGKNYKIENFLQLKMPEFMVSRNQIIVFSDAQSLKFKLPIFFSEVLITPRSRDEEKVITDQLTMEFTV